MTSQKRWMARLWAGILVLIWAAGLRDAILGGLLPGFVRHPHEHPYPIESVLITCLIITVESSLLFAILWPFDFSKRRTLITFSVFMPLLMADFFLVSGWTDQAGYAYSNGFFLLLVVGFLIVASLSRIFLSFRRLNLILAVAMLVCTGASCGPKTVENHRSRCAFSDPDFMTQFRVCTVVAQYYVDKHEWPSSKAELKQQWQVMLNAEKEKTPSETMESSEFLDQFTILELRKNGQNLALHYSFKGDKQTIDQRLTLKPGNSSDQIIHEASD